MSEQLPITPAPAPKNNLNKVSTTRASNEVSDEKQSEFGGVLANQVEQKGTGKKAGVSASGPETETDKAAINTEKTEEGLPQDGKDLPIEAALAERDVEWVELGSGQVEIAAEAVEVAETTLADAISVDEVALSDETLTTVVAGTATATAVVVDEKIAVAGRAGADKPVTPVLVQEAAKRVIRGQVATNAIDDGARTQVVEQQRRDAFLPGNVISLAARAESEKTPFQANRIIEQFTDVSARQTGNAQPSTASTLTPLSPVMTTGSATSSATGLQQVSIDVPVQHQQWQKAFAERVVWSVGNNQSIQVRVNPAELGPIDIQVNVTKEQAHITFNAAHASTRDSIESALPRLRDMLANEGLSLGDVDVRHQDSSAQGQTSARDGQGGGSAQADSAQVTAAGEQAEVMLRPIMISDRAVDYYI